MNPTATTTSPSLSVSVVGGSLGGLTAALVLRNAGCDVCVYERSPRPLSGRGSGIVGHPATYRWLLAHGPRDPMTVAAQARQVRYLAADGTVEAEVPCHYRFSSYSSLYNDLRSAFDADRYELNREMTAIEQGDDGVTIAFADGGEARSQLLVCADGIRSRGRELLLPDAQPRYAGYAAWRGTIRERRLSAAARAALNDAIVYVLLPKSHLLAYTIPGTNVGGQAGERLVNWLWYVNLDASPALGELLTDRDGRRHTTGVPQGLVKDRDIRALQERALAHLPTAMAEMVLETSAPYLQLIFDLDVPRMAFGRVALIGDAAGILRPHVAVGTAKAADDAWSLAEAVVASGFDVPAALRHWEPERLALLRAASERARVVGERIQIHSDWQAGEPLPFGLYAADDSQFIMP